MTLDGDGKQLSESKQRMLDWKLRQAAAGGRTIPEEISCKVCSKAFRNPILRGSSIVTVVCDPCRIAIVDSYRPKKRTKRTKRPTMSPPPPPPPLPQGLGEEGSLARPPTVPNSLSGWMVSP